MAVLLRYRYFQPVGGRHCYVAEPAAGPTFCLVYSGAIPAGESESVDGVLERLILRHSTQIRPQGTTVRPIGSGDVLDLGERGWWQVAPLGFRAVDPQQMRIEQAA